MSPRTTAVLRVLMLVVIAMIALENASGMVDPDLSIPFVCIIAVMGIGTRGGPLDSLGTVLIELAVVLVLGIATLSGSRELVWAASVAISVLAVGKIALLEMSRGDEKRARRSRPSGETSAETRRPSPVPASEAEHSEVRARVEAELDAAAQPLGTISPDERVAPLSGSMSLPPIAQPPEPTPASSSAPSDAGSSARPRKKRERTDQTPVARSGRSV